MLKKTCMQAKLRASVLWLLSKAYMPKIPPDLYEPCYRDHEGNDRLKPQIVHALANAELYCLALANIYADPNYHNLNHHGILQILMRKGVEITEPPEALTETILVQTAPIRMSSHLAVIEGIMALFIKEVLIPEKVMEVVSRFSVVDTENEMPYDCEEAALLWINKCCIKMRHKIEDELRICHTPDDSESSPIHRSNPPTIALAQDLGDLSDGCCLAALLSLYCPKFFRWQDIRLDDPMSLADSVHNLQLVQKFCQDYMTQDIYCLTLEDMVYLHPSVIPNVLALIADLMYIFEIRPPKYVCRPGVKEEQVVNVEASGYVYHNSQRQSSLTNCRLKNFQQSVSPIPDLRSGACGDSGQISPRPNGTWQRQPQKSSSARRISAPDDRRFEGSRLLRRTHSMNFSETNRYSEPLPLQSSVFSPQRYHVEEDEELAGYFTPQYNQQQTLLNQKENRRTRHVSSDNITFPQQQSHYQVFHTPNPLTEDSTPGHLDVLRERNDVDSQWSEQNRSEHEHSLQRSPTSYQVHHRSPSRQHELGKRSGYPKQRSQSDLNLPAEKRLLNSRHSNPQDSASVNYNLFQMQSGSYDQLALEEKVETGAVDQSTLYEDNRNVKSQRSGVDHQTSKEHEYESQSRPLSGSQTWKKPKDLFQRSEWNKENVDSVSDQQDSYANQETDDHMNTVSFADLSKQRNSSSSAINIVYMQQEKEHTVPVKKPVRPGYLHISSSLSGTSSSSPTSGYVHLPNQEQDFRLHPDSVDASVTKHMHDIKLKLEEKRKRIEQEKARLESLSKKQREKVGKAAFLQAVRGGGSSSGSPGSKGDTGFNSPHEGGGIRTRNYSVDDITEDLDTVRRKWLEKKADHGPDAAGDSDESEIPSEDVQASIEQLNSSLTDLQSDISRLTQQQELIQKMLRNNETSKAEPQNYFLHEQNPPLTNSKWAEPVPGASQMFTPHMQQQPLPQDIPHPGRGHWGQPVKSFPGLQHQQSALQNQSMCLPPQMHSMRPSSAEPQMMGGQPSYLYDRPPAAPFLNSGHSLGFSLHPQQQQQVRMPFPYSNTYQDDSQNNYFQEQYPYNAVQQVQPPQQNYLMQNSYMNTNYDAQSQMLNQSSGFHLHRSPSVSYIQNQGQSQVPPGQGNVLYQPFSPPRSEAMDVPRSQSQTNLVNPQDNQPTACTDDFGRPVKSTPLQNSPPNRPVLGKTFRVPKPKLTSPSAPDPGHSPLLSPSGQSEQIQESQGVHSPLPDAVNNDKGFYISFDDVDQPRKPKPKLKPKHLKTRSQQKKMDFENESGRTEGDENKGSPLKNEHFSSSGTITIPKRHSWKSPQEIFQNISDDVKREDKAENEEKTDESEEMSENAQASAAPGVGFVIGAGLVESDPDKELEMTRRKEMIMMMSLQRRAEQEAKRNVKQQEYLQKKEKDRMKKEEQDRKKEEEKLRRQLILEQYRQRKAQEESEECGGGGGREEKGPTRGSTFTRPKSRSTSVTRAKPKGGQSTGGRYHDLSSPSSLDSPVGRGSHTNLAGGFHDDVSSEHSYTSSPRRSQTYPHSSPISPTSYPSSPSPLYPGMLGIGRNRGTPSDGLSDTSSTISSAWTSEYTGPKLFVKPATKSNRGIITNAVNTVLAGAVNAETKRKVIEEMDRSDGKHFLILFRDAGCQFRALYSYNPETEEVIKLYGIGPRVVTDKMMDRFYKYNSGGKSFTQIHTKHLTATIDAFTIQNSLWQGKKVVPLKRDYL